jgi:biopolymer transport protein ExbD
MAEIQENNSGKGKEGKGKQKKMTIRVDFTPMVDMNMLLITFFMLCTSLSKPQTMEISMPTKDTQEDMQTKVAASRAITLLLGEDDKVYYYLGEPNYQDYTSLKETTYTPDGLRAVLLARNANVVARIIEEKEAGRRDHRRGVQDAVHRDQERRERSHRFDQGNRRVDL